ncbi:MAG: Ig domain-containing protein [Steroidobacteraceae bacterium]
MKMLKGLLISLLSISVFACGDSAVDSAGGSTPAATNPPVAASSTLEILPGQVVYGQVDQNGGTYSLITPYLLIATGGNVGPSGYTWTVPTGESVPIPAAILNPLGIITDATPASLQSGTYSYPIEVSDGTSTQTSTVTIDLTTLCNSSNGNSNNPCASSVLTNVHIPYLPNGTIGSTYAASIVTSGGTPPYSWAVGGGTLPPGLTIDQGNGIIAGTPTTAGTYNFYVLTTDSAANNTSSEISAGVLGAEFALVVN